jgi:hypothetical protein
MPYAQRFQHADDVVAHLNTVVPNLADPLLKAKYTGFVTIAAVTVYEMAIKDIFSEFAAKKHAVFGRYVESKFKRINGKIGLDVIKDDYVKGFGGMYLKRFKVALDNASDGYLRQNRRDFRSAYGNLIVWRNDFAHEGSVKAQTTYEEVVQAYEDGKQVIHTLATSMVR